MGKLIPHSLRIAYLNLQRNGRRSLLSVLIVAIAVFALTSAGGFGLYTYDSLQESTARDTGHLTLSQPGFFEQDEEMPLANGLANTESIVKQLLANQNVRGVQPRIEFTGLVSNGTKSTIFVGTGVNDREFDMKGPFLDVRKGKTLSNTQSPRYDATEPEVMLAVDLAKNLNVTTNDWVTLLATTSDGALNAFDFKVRGIYSTGVPELDKRQLYLHIESVQSLLASHKISTLSVFLYGTEQTAQTQGWVEDQLNGMNLEQAVEVTPWEKRAFYYKRVKDLYDRIFGIMGAVMALVVFVALFNTMTMSVTERTREIGTLSALGTYPNEIVSGFVREAGLLAILGALMGGAMTLATSLILLVAEVQMPPPPGQTDGYPLNIYFSAELLAYCAAGVVIICVGAAWISARKGVNKPITEALVYV
ncbi:ABC transporter permease [Vibrio genomosp. F10]|uniref:ABC transporter permease n=2 Tax=Vibrio genomosp. F10 TaxID=723171 RepID=A0A1B9QXU2_9VIBR|nr:FtsX-like permease family protein [Vibrio genomosp. F10]OCH75059.1 ABC transporter permease [Vibrio genomosp. F10]OEE30855.1 ABC transporter permease [Vibrio genomosp. F10 str. ZF-129]OEE98056.1 ABC transporter permease [Vibrio genomosp. F10 str. 9ZC157]OEF03194.1 ABC transporter permease [Vibrio genomosp. F10 str. 9ZD137]OEF05329.1 ABC transporter permease [Vibrio genomosp. F10 str. 9ZB36]